MKAKATIDRILLAAAAIMLCIAATCFGYALLNPSTSTASDGMTISDYSGFATPATVVNGNVPITDAALPKAAILSSNTSSATAADDGSQAAVSGQGASGSEAAAATAATDAKAPQTGSGSAAVSTNYVKDNLYIKGITIPYRPSYMTATAPSTGAGLWNGSDSTSDGTWGYFIGHNPGPFYVVSGLHEGDVVTVCDSDGNARSYTVYSVFDVPNTTTWEEIEPYVEGHGESITLQTCVENNCYRIIRAA